MLVQLREIIISWYFSPGRGLNHRAGLAQVVSAETRRQRELEMSQRPCFTVYFCFKLNGDEISFQSALKVYFGYKWRSWPCRDGYGCLFLIPKTPWFWFPCVALSWFQLLIKVWEKGLPISPVIHRTQGLKQLLCNLCCVLLSPGW